MIRTSRCAVRTPHPFTPHPLYHPLRRPYSTPPPPNARIDRIFSRLPRFLQRYTTPLRSAPLTHITSFLILHEITAIAPLFSLAAFFHYTAWLPPYISEGKYVSDGVEKFGNYFRRKGWISDDQRRGRWWGRGEGGVRIVVEFATAYAVTKALLPLRIVLSVWATPWFARVAIGPVMQGLRKLGRRKKQ